jgi:uncharacterized membrane protein (DUF2068 family)
MKRPASLTIAVVLQWIAAIAGIWVGFMFILASIAMLDPEARQQVQDALTEAGVSDITPMMAVAALFLLAVTIMAIGVIRLIVAISLGRGRNWARILVTILSAFSLAGAIAQLFGGEWLTGIVTIAIEVVILWLMWNKSSSAYIKTKTAERAVAAAAK